MRRIIVAVPKGNIKRWKLSGLGTKNKGFASPTSLYNWLERAFRVRRMRKKTFIRVQYDYGTNESLASTNPSYLLFVLACFLEDYITRGFFKEKLKRYGPKD